MLKSTFTDDEYNTVVANLKAAGNAWAQTCNIKFEHKPSLDNSPDSDDGPPDGVLFSVKKTTPSDGVIASSFFPRSPASQRVLLVFPFYFQDDMPYDRVGTFRHELGHILCFRHEHIRSEAPPVCATRRAAPGRNPADGLRPPIGHALLLRIGEHVGTPSTGDLRRRQDRRTPDLPIPQPGRTGDPESIVGQGRETLKPGPG